MSILVVAEHDNKSLKRRRSTPPPPRARSPSWPRRRFTSSSSARDCGRRRGCSQDRRRRQGSARDDGARSRAREDVRRFGQARPAIPSAGAATTSGKNLMLGSRHCRRECRFRHRVVVAPDTFRPPDLCRHGARHGAAKDAIKIITCAAPRFRRSRARAAVPDREDRSDRIGRPDAFRQGRIINRAA